MMWEPITSDAYFWLGALVFFVLGWVIRGDESADINRDSMLLLTLEKLGESYSVPLRHELSSTTGWNISLGYVYTRLDRLEKRGLVTSRQGEATRERGWRRKVYYRLTHDGEKLVKILHAVEEMTKEKRQNR